MMRQILVQVVHGMGTEQKVFVVFAVCIIIYVVLFYRKYSKSKYRYDSEEIKTLTSVMAEEKLLIFDSIQQMEKQYPKEQAFEIKSKQEIIAGDKYPTMCQYIGYEPINKFIQTESLKYPYVVMPPKAGCALEYQRRERQGRKGYKEDAFFSNLQKHFGKCFQLYNNGYVLEKKNINPYEPDIMLIDETEGLNLFLDIEIDEPYEGINDISGRKVTHCQFVNTKRDNSFGRSGWVVIRFAEIQVHQNPDGCCRFIADVINSINPNFDLPISLLKAKRVTIVQQWTKDVATKWSLEKYREHYLNIKAFGVANEDIKNEVSDVDKEVVDEEKVMETKSVSKIPCKYVCIGANFDTVKNGANAGREYVVARFLPEGTDIRSGRRPRVLNFFAPTGAEEAWKEAWQATVNADASDLADTTTTAYFALNAKEIRVEVPNHAKRYRVDTTISIKQPDGSVKNQVVKAGGLLRATGTNYAQMFNSIVVFCEVDDKDKPLLGEDYPQRVADRILENSCTLWEKVPATAKVPVDKGIVESPVDEPVKNEASTEEDEL